MHGPGAHWGTGFLAHTHEPHSNKRQPLSSEGCSCPHRRGSSGSLGTAPSTHDGRLAVCPPVGETAEAGRRRETHLNVPGTGTGPDPEAGSHLQGDYSSPLHR